MPDVSEYPQSSDTLPGQEPQPEPYADLSDAQRKQVKLTRQAQSITKFFGIVVKGIGKIVEEVSSAILKR